jgi:CHAT domain-containing protein
MLKGDQGVSWDVLHFIGHGSEGELALEEEGGTGIDWITTETLKGYLIGPNGPQLVILNACKGAKRGPRNPLASIAESLARGGQIPAVVAMQFEISDDMAIAFSPAFFNNLMLEDVPLQTAMTATRLDLQYLGFTEWISPVLYMQNRDGRVMPPAPGGRT